jgi:large subunit ribosomal protein L17
MRHARSGKKLGRDSAHRKALYANLAGALIEHGRIKTTVTKAKAVKPLAEQMITLGRRGDIHARRQAVAFLRSKEIVHHLFTVVGPSFAERPGGYARIVKLGPRQGDSAEMAYLELVTEPLVLKTKLEDLTPEQRQALEEDDAVAEAEVDDDYEPEGEYDYEPEGEFEEDAEAESDEEPGETAGAEPEAGSDEEETPKN